MAVHPDSRGALTNRQLATTNNIANRKPSMASLYQHVIAHRRNYRTGACLVTYLHS